ncbi:hypothetical protein [Neorhizobium sp. SOG26]|uniref:hypothetical protein n=1 Tax=Neorhizobium sp. SOG26 TaxID=2060726 RepID=UPI0030ECE6B1
MARNKPGCRFHLVAEHCVYAKLPQLSRSVPAERFGQYRRVMNRSQDAKRTAWPRRTLDDAVQLTPICSLHRLNVKLR